MKTIIEIYLPPNDPLEMHPAWNRVVYTDDQISGYVEEGGSIRIFMRGKEIIYKNCHSVITEIKGSIGATEQKS